MITAIGVEHMEVLTGQRVHIEEFDLHLVASFPCKAVNARVADTFMSFNALNGVVFCRSFFF